jgi:hypothetical protein
LAILLRNGTLEELFQYVEIADNGCWEWSKHLLDGYGSIEYKGKDTGAHRFSYTITKGEIEPNMLICHTCDNRKCINPDHLFQGNHQDNMDDMKKKGRQPDNKGIKNPKAKLTELQIKEIRKIGHTIPYAHTAKKYKVTPEMISFIVRKINWNNI